MPRVAQINQSGTEARAVMAAKANFEVVRANARIEAERIVAERTLMAEAQFLAAIKAFGDAGGSVYMLGKVIGSSFDRNKALMQRAMLTNVATGTRAELDVRAAGYEDGVYILTVQGTEYPYYVVTETRSIMNAPDSAGDYIDGTDVFAEIGYDELERLANDAA